MNMEKSAYEKDLKKRQKQHLKNVRRGLQNEHWQPCIHDSCVQCVGTGIRIDGSPCIHMMHCSCPKCNPYAITSPGMISVSGTGVEFSITSGPNLTITDGINGYFINTSTDTWTVKTIDS